MRRSFNVPATITRPYGEYDPVAYANYPEKKHPGTDYNLAAGTPLVAGMSGTVTTYPRGRTTTGRGNEVVITNGNMQRKTCHMNAIYVQTGQKVNEGDPIGLSGNTGYVLPAPTAQNPNAGAHLHDELLIDGKYVDGEKYLKEHDMSADKITKEEYQELHKAYTGQEAPEFGNVGKNLSEVIQILKSAPGSKEWKRRADSFEFWKEEVRKRDDGLELLRKEIKRLYEIIGEGNASEVSQVKETLEKVKSNLESELQEINKLLKDINQ